MKIDVGIDLGTTYSTFAVYENQMVKILKNSKDSPVTPSVVYIEDGSVLIGDDAKEYQRQGNTNTASFYKSRMGDASYFAYHDGKEYSASDLSAIFLREMKKDIEETNHVTIDHAVITVPAYFNDKQREATLLAGKKAGLNVVKIINEPTSAIIAYGLKDGKDKNVMVYDLGGGTFDVTIAQIKDDKISILSTNGNHQLGGKDFDEQIREIVSEQIQSQLGLDIYDFPEDDTELTVKCEDIKKRLTLSASVSSTVYCDGKAVKISVTREDFEERCASLLQETFDLVDLCFEEISHSQGKAFTCDDISEVVLVGGSTRMPLIKKEIVKRYHKEPITKDINVDTIVASGAAMQVALTLHSKISLMVAKKDEHGKTNSCSLVLNNSDIEDITAHGLGMISLDSSKEHYVNSIIIPKNSKVNHVFSKDYRFSGKELEVFALQGENRDPLLNDFLGYYVITKIEGSKDDLIKVNFLYNSNGIVEVSAIDSLGNELHAEKKSCDKTIEEILNELKEKAEREKQGQVVELTVLIDTSGSMSGDPLIEAKAQAKNFINKFENGCKASISFGEFATRFKYLIKKSNDFEKIEKAIDKVEINDVGYGNQSCPIKETYLDFSKESKMKFLVILTDGVWNNPNSEIENAKRAKERGVEIFAIGIGTADEDFLNQISSEKGIKVDLSELSSAFDEVASTIASEISQRTLN